MIGAMVYRDSLDGPIQQEYHGEFVREWLAIVLLPLCMLTVLDVLALEAFYMVLLFKTDRVAQDRKALWAGGLLVGSFLAMLLFWYICIWGPLEGPSHPE